MGVKVKEQFQVSTFFTFFLIHASQTSVGLLNYQSIISKNAQQDAWISLIMTGVSIHIVLFIIFKLLDQKNNDLVAVHHYCFGKILGNILSLLVLIYFLSSNLTIFRTYIEIIQEWVYPTIKTWQLSIIFGLTLYYIVSSGFRNIAGFSFWGVIIPSFLFGLIYFPMKHMDFTYLLPAFSHSIKDLLQSAKASIMLFLGFEWILMYFPFLKGSSKVPKWAHIGTFYSLFIYLIITFVSFLYFNQEVLQHIPWATLMMVKIVQFSFVERFEYIFIFIWLLVILPPLCISLWSCSRIAKRTFSIQPKVSIGIFLFLIGVTSISLKEFENIDKLTNFNGNVGFYFLYIYIPLLLVIKLIKNGFIKSKIG